MHAAKATPTSYRHPPLQTLRAQAFAALPGKVRLSILPTTPSESQSSSPSTASSGRHLVRVKPVEIRPLLRFA
jgi:hypothetical protein